jgi:hypothetical protein
MAKNINARVSPLSHQSEKPNIVSILPISPPGGQSQNYKRLTQAVRQRELTTSLEILAESGIEEDLALFIIANLQQMEVAA